jgi:GT2 family glycosyltransferase/glycosyltransferase involved in cell wall biosynthesis
LRSFVRGLSTFQAPANKPVPQKLELPDYIFWGVIDWHFRHQRPQQLSLALAETGRRVFYIAPKFRVDSRAGFEVEQLDANGRVFQVTLFNKDDAEGFAHAPSENTVEHLRRSVGEMLMWADTGRIVSTVQHPFWLDVASVLPDSRLVYDCMDHHEGFKNTGAALVQLEKELFKKADLTVTTSGWLDKSVAAFASRKTVVRNAGDYRHFSVKPAKIFKDPAGRKILGYYGAIADWLDLELVETLAQKFAECLIVLVGADTIHAKPRLSKYRNIKFVGEVNYKELPYYLHAFDVCLLPFKVVPLTLATNPVKVYEYLSAGKPVVAPPLPEMAQFGDLVSTAADHSEFVNAISSILSKIESAPLIERRRKFAQHETWSERAATLIENVETAAFDSKVSVVVVTFNNIDLTRACLASLEANSDYENLEIIVVDNASSDGSPEFLKTWASQGANRRLILNDDNRGFAAANNQGLAVATGEYLAMLNNDTFVTPGWIRTLVNHLKRDHGIGLIGPVTGNIGNEAKIDIHYSNMTEMISEARAYTRRHVGGTYPLRTAAFFCVMLRKQTFDRVGPLDEIFGRGFFEDDDYCRRIEKIGLRIVCADDVFIHHHLSASFNKLKQKDREKLFEENKKLYEAKWGEWIPHGYRKPTSASRAQT